MPGPPQRGRKWVENPTLCWDRSLLLGGRWVPEGPRPHPNSWLPLLVASEVGDRDLGLTPVLGDPKTAALLSGLLLCFESPPRTAQCQDHSQGPVLPRLCSSPQSPKLWVAKEWVGGP